MNLENFFARGYNKMKILCFLPYIKCRVKCIEILGIKMFFHDIQAFAEALEVYDFTLSQETDWVTYFRIFYKAQDIFIS